MALRRVFTVFRRAAAIALGLWGLASPAAAQRSLKLPSMEVFGGYSYLRYDTKPLGFANQLNLSGVNTEFYVHIYHELGIAADFSGHFSSEMKEFNFLVGPQLTYEWKGMRLYGHGLAGKARDRLTMTGTSQLEPSTLGGALAFGGGVDLPRGDHWIWRPVQADYLITGAFGNKPKSLRISTGIVYRFGKKPKNEPTL